MTVDIYCPSCGYRKTKGTHKQALRGATEHNQSCLAQRADYKPEVVRVSNVEIEEDDFQWYPGWERDWEKIEEEVERW